MTAELTPEQWLDDMAANVAADDADAERQAIDAIQPYQEAKAAENLYKASAAKLRKPIDAWFILHPGETSLPDLERRLEVYLQSGGKEEFYDKPSAIKERSPALYHRLEELGLLIIDKKGIEEAFKNGWLTKADMKPFTHEGDKTPSLRTRVMQ